MTIKCVALGCSDNGRWQRHAAVAVPVQGKMMVSKLPGIVNPSEVYTDDVLKIIKETLKQKSGEFSKSLRWHTQKCRYYFIGISAMLLASSPRTSKEFPCRLCKYKSAMIRDRPRVGFQY